jgi:serine O-acetyltransferase
MNFRFSLGSIDCDRHLNVKRSFSLALALSQLARALRDDFAIIFKRDPAARNWLEVLLCYPGLHALLVYRFSHALSCRKIPVLPRFLSHVARGLTGIEIHPGAAIAPGACIDHGIGVVIGETAIVGDRALIYQGVTLGGTGKDSGKRHPTLGNNVVVGAGAKVLGNIEIGDNVRIGAGAVVLRDVPPNCTVVGVPGRIVRRRVDRADMPDLAAAALRALDDRLTHLERQVQSISAHPQTHVSTESSPPQRRAVRV